MSESKKRVRMTIKLGDKNAYGEEVIEATNPSERTNRELISRAWEMFQKEFLDQLTFATNYLSKLKPGQKKVFVTTPVRIKIEGLVEEEITTP